jgi:hypothetical protein
LLALLQAEVVMAEMVVTMHIVIGMVVTDLAVEPVEMQYV